MALASSSGFLLQSSAPEFLPARNLKSCGNPGWAAGRLCSRGPGSRKRTYFVTGRGGPVQSFTVIYCLSYLSCGVFQYCKK